MILTIHEPIAPKGQGVENIKATMAEAYTAVESSLPEKFKGRLKRRSRPLKSFIRTAYGLLAEVSVEAFCLTRRCSSINCMFSFAFERNSFIN